MFENNLVSGPSLRSQVLLHLPLAVIVVGVLAAFVALHLAVTGIIIAALAHVAFGLVLLAARRYRASS